MRSGWRLMRWLVAGLALLAPRPATAGCAPIAQGTPRGMPYVMLADAAPDGLRITFLGHASFLIETPQGVRVVTDYNGVNVPEFPPDIATMNHAHSTHYTDHPDPRIKYVMHGWRDDGGPAQIDLVFATCTSATCRPTSATGRAGRSITATRSSCSKARGCAWRI